MRGCTSKEVCAFEFVIDHRAATANNARRDNKPNPDQEYFRLVVTLSCLVEGRDSPIFLFSKISDPLIVRGSNPAQYADKSPATQETSHTFHGNVGINTTTPQEALTVVGNIQLTGDIMRRSDARVKEEVKEVDTSQQLENISKVRLYNYKMKENWRDTVGGPSEETGGEYKVITLTQ